MSNRISQSKDSFDKWNGDNVRKELEQFDMGRVQRIWVCGPPNMNETFDKAFEKMINEGFPLRKDQYDVI